MVEMVEQIALKISELFVNRNDCFARQSLTKAKKKSFLCIKEPIIPELIKAHLLDQDFLGVYQLNLENKVKWGCADFDLDTKEDFENCFKLLSYSKEQGYNPMPELSGGGKNNLKVHLWFFSKDLIPAEQMKNFLEHICKEANVNPHEIFPKQTSLAEEGFGNLLKLPLGKHLETERSSYLLDDNGKTIYELPEVLDKLNYHLEHKDLIPIIIKQITEYIKPSVNFNAYEFDKFFNYCIYNELPKGISVQDKKYKKIEGINSNILKNEAIWFHKKGYTLDQLEEQVKPIFEKNGWAFCDLKGWFKKAQNNKLTDICSGEIAEWCKTYSPELLELLPSNKSEGYKLSPYSDADLENYIPEPQSWLIENQIPKGEIGLLVGKRGEFKTWTAIKQTLGLSAGVEIFGDKVPEPKKVLFIDEESGKNQISIRRNLLKAGMGLKQSLDIKFLSFEGLKLDRLDSEKFKQFKQLVEDFKPDLIIVDCFARVVSFEIDKDNASINDLFTGVIRPFIKLYGMTWLFLHHLRKSPSGNIKIDDSLDEVRGGSELVNYCRFVLMCKSPRYQVKSEDGSRMFIFQVLKMSNAEMPEPKVISFIPDNPQDTKAIKMEYAGTCEDVLAVEVRAGNSIIEYLFNHQITGEFTTKDITNNAEEIGFKRSFISVGLKSLVEQGKLSKVKRGVYAIIGKNQTPKNQKTLDNSKEDSKNRIKIKIIKETEKCKVGEIVEATKKNAESYVKNGFAEYIQEEKLPFGSPKKTIEEQTKDLMKTEDEITEEEIEEDLNKDDFSEDM